MLHNFVSFSYIHKHNKYFLNKLPETHIQCNTSIIMTLRF